MKLRARIAVGGLVVCVGLLAAVVWSGRAQGQYKFEQGECVTADPCSNGNCTLVSDPPNTACYAWTCSNSASNQEQHCRNASGSTKCFATLESTHSCTGGSCKYWTCVYDSSGFCKAVDSAGGNCRCPSQGGTNYPNPWIAKSCFTGS